ncbi:hypothetical protein ACQ4PT_025190 [Festuca glaucescens]
MKGARRSSSSNRRLLASFLDACRKLAAASAAPTTSDWARLHAGDDEAAIPVDVPRGHTVVYVGAELRRHVVRVSSLGHPLFRELLDDRARGEHAFAADARLCLPCDEDIFLAVLCHVDSKHEYCRRLVLCS